MKSFVMASFLLTNAIGSALGVLISPTAKDPHLTVTYASLAGVMTLTAIVFWFSFKKLNAREEDMNKLDIYDSDAKQQRALDVGFHLGKKRVRWPSYNGDDTYVSTLGVGSHASFDSTVYLDKNGTGVTESPSSPQRWYDVRRH
jgi:hypothetical protein